MIFLGAGASKIFGVKTLQDMTDDLIKKMENKGYGDTIKKILENLKRFDLTPDFESIFTILEGLTNPKEAVKNSGAFTAYVCRDLKEIGTYQEFKELLHDFKDFIYKECTIKSENLRIKKSVYDKLFEIIASSSRHGNHLSSYDNRVFTTAMGSGSGGTTVNIGDTIATTNYDMSVELYHRMIGSPLADGFETTNDPYIKQIDAGNYARLSNARWLIKLHGSIWQFKQGKKIIKTIADPKNSPIDIKIDEEMMIYPIGEKPMLKDPYHVFYDFFRQQRWNQLIAIGYSFRDDPVNIAILENLQRNEGSVLIAINPHPDEVIRNFGVSPLKFDDRIILIKDDFGSETSFEKLKLAIQARSWKVYQEKAEERLKEEPT